MLQALIAAGFEVDFRSHAKAILQLDFPEVEKQLEEVLLASTIPIEEIVGSGGGETKGTQRLRNALKQRGWHKHNFVVQRTIDGVPREAQSHEVDHIRTFDAGTVALEIEWNNKDPFFDRDLENFKRLHADGAISLGIIITRGAALQDAMKSLVRRFADEKEVNSHDDMDRLGLNPTRRQRADVMRRVERKRNPVPFRDAWVDHFVGDKFGAATTHWRKLEDRVHRGVGNPCPLVLIGFPAGLVTFGEDPAEVQKLIAEGQQEASAETAQDEQDGSADKPQNWKEESADTPQEQDEQHVSAEGKRWAAEYIDGQWRPTVVISPWVPSTSNYLIAAAVADMANQRKLKWIEWMRVFDLMGEMRTKISNPANGQQSKLVA
jgi:hypothetical protein